MQTVSDYYKKLFGSKVYKISLDLGCTCPTRDGTIGTGGCIFCNQNGSGDFVSNRRDSITDQIEQAKLLVNKKFSRAVAHGEEVEKKYIAYFQNFTNTYGDTENLVKKYKEALNAPNVVGLALGTRPDCLKEDMIRALGALSENHYVQIELGLQTINEKTADYCRRGFSNEVYIEAVKKLRAISNNRIHIVTHLIFGLPGDTENDMIEGVKFVSMQSRDVDFGIKITCLYILKGTDLADIYINKKIKLFEEDEYLELLKKAISVFPKNIVIHRLTGDPPKKMLIAPQWTTNKRKIMNKIQRILNDSV